MAFFFGCFLGGGCVLMLLVVWALYAAHRPAKQPTRPPDPAAQTYEKVVAQWNKESETALHDFMDTLFIHEKGK